MADHFKARGLTPAEIKRHLRTLANERAVLPVAKGEEVARGENFSLLEHDGLAPELLEADLAWHVRAWGRWVLGEARPMPTILKGSAIREKDIGFDVVLTDPPYYDAIPYSDLMDFFYVWLSRTLSGLSSEIDAAFSEPLAPKWSHEHNDGELIDDASRFDGDKQASKRNYEDGMARAFKACHSALNLDGRLVIVFAHKHPDAWETLVGAIIKAGFVVDGSWPIQTEMGNRTRALSSAALSSSVWLICKKRDPLARAGWDTQVLKEMEGSITTRLRDFWDAGIRGPDFIWAATGPALESYSRYPAVKKVSGTGALMSVTDFLGHVRRIVVDFVVGRVLSHGQGEPTPGDHPLDDVTTYYLLHRNDFGLKEAPAGPCILYAVSCGLSERELTDQYELLARSGSAAAAEDEDDAGNEEDGDADESPSSGGGGKYRLRDWRARKHRSLGMETPSGRAIPLIDQVHKLMQLWVAGEVVKVNEFLDNRADLSPENWLLGYMAANIDCVAVTDHNSGAWIDRLNTAYGRMKNENAPPPGFRELTIFPGVEISANAGVHVLAIFDPGRTTGDIDTLLGAVGYRGTKGDSDGVTEKGVAEVIHAIIDAGGIPVPAHADRVKGLLQCRPDAGGPALDAHTLRQALEVEGLLAVEWCDPGQPWPQCAERHRSSLAAVLGSDCHSFQGNIGARFPLRLFSQGQIAAMAGSGRQALLALIDEAAGVAPLQEALHEARRTFLAQRARLRELDGKLAQRPELQRQFDDAVRRLAAFDQSDHAAVLRAYAQAQRQEREVQGTLEDLAKWPVRVRQLAEALLLDDWPAQAFTDGDAEVLSWRSDADRLGEETRTTLQVLAAQMEQNVQTLGQEPRLAAWRARKARPMP